MQKIVNFIFVFLALFWAVCTNAKVKLGIDVLEEMQFAPLWNKRVGLLTHPAGVNNRGVSTIDVLMRAKNVKLTALYGPEHGIYGNEKANVPVDHKIDKRTGLPVYSLYGKYRKPTPEMLKGIDILVIDLQDIGCRSYTYVSCMIRAMEACFENQKQVLVLDRPNPLGGLKIDGPMLDMKFKSYVGMINVPYVHGLTIGEIAKMAKSTKGWLEITSKQQANGRLKVIPMKGWTRSMRWPATGLKWVPTSPAIPDFSAVVGYSMTGLGCQIGPFQHGYGMGYPFRFLTYGQLSASKIKKALLAKNIAGISFTEYTINTPKGKKNGLYVSVDDWEKFKPTQLSFYLMQITCEFESKNPFAAAKANDALLFNKHTGSQAWWNEISTKGKNAYVGKFIRMWDAQNAEYALWAKKFYLYK